jgi:hypothetical protein
MVNFFTENATLKNWKKIMALKNILHRQNIIQLLYAATSTETSLMKIIVSAKVLK